MFRLGLAVAFALLTVIATFVPVTLPFISGHLPVGDGIRLVWQGPSFYLGLGIWSVQIEAMLLAPLVLGLRLGTLSQLVYLGVGLSGWPVFYQGGGSEVWAGPTAGYIMGVVPACLVCGLLAERRPAGWLQHLQGAVAGLIFLHVCGFVLAFSRLTGTTWSAALSTLVLWPLQGHLLLLVPLTAVTAVIARFRPRLSVSGRPAPPLEPGLGR
ncbi:MAG: biotin transporter BioY [Candidatus Sericytochromatia bacterium]|nr:biotin transporter BioY [Candidatus Sericytochromatia bacterium]